MNRRGGWFLAASLALCLGSASCEPPSPAPPSHLSVFATTFPLSQIAREIGGEWVDTDWLIELGKPLSGFTMTRRERDRMAATNFTLCDSFRRTETWAAPDLAQRRNTGSVLTLDNLPAATAADYPAGGLLELDPAVASEFAPVLADALANAQPKLGTIFRNRATAFAQDVDALRARYPRQSSGGAKVVVLSNTFAPLLYRCGVQSVLVDCDAYRLSGAEADTIRKAASDTGAAAVILPFDLPPGAVTRIEKLTGLKSIALDAVGLSGFKGHDTYLAILEYDLAQLQAFLVPLPPGEVR